MNLKLDNSYSPENLILSPQELKALARILEHDYVNYEDLEAKKVIDKIFNKIKEFDK